MGYPLIMTGTLDASGAGCSSEGTQIDWLTVEKGGAGGQLQVVGGPLCNCPMGSSCYQGPQGMGPIVYCQ